MKQRERKAEKINTFKEHLEHSQAVVIADYKGLTVKQMEELRAKLRGAGGSVSVIKNTLARVALNDIGIDTLDADLQGQVAFVFSEKDAVAGTKVASDFAKAQKQFNIVSGLFDGRRLTLDQVKELAALPGRHELQGKLVGILIAPLADMVGTFQAPFREFIGTLEAYAKKNDQGEVPAA